MSHAKMGNKRYAVDRNNIKFIKLGRPAAALGFLCSGAGTRVRANGVCPWGTAEAFPQHLTQGSQETLLLLFLPPGPGHTLLPSDFSLSSPKHGVLGPLPREAWGSG